MSDLFDQPPQGTNPPPLPKSADLQVDPRLLAKALKKMQGLVRGNGIKAEDVSIDPNPEGTGVQIYRFRARTRLKLVPEYGIKTEAGRNTKAELMATQAEFNTALSRTIIEARTIPERRKQIVDFMFARTDKGFGIEEQRIKFHALNRNFVQHEKCLPCKNTGRIMCNKCQGHGIMPCANCQGRRQVVCPRCRGTTKMHVNNKTIPCTYCRHDGKVNCPKCAGRGQMKCATCASSGSLQCQPCAGTGWLSHLAHIEIFAQIFFDFEREVLPPPLVTLIEHNAPKLVEKNDIEVVLKDGWTPDEKTARLTARGEGAEQKKETDGEPDDTIWLDYDAICPYGPITFKLKERIISANLFGFQARLNDCPSFLDDLTRIGQQALTDAATGRGDVIGKIKRAAKYALLRDIMAQTLRLKNPVKTQQLLVTKYTAGMKAEKFGELILASDLALRHISRKGRTMGLIIGLIAFAGFMMWYYLLEGKATLLPNDLKLPVTLAIEATLIPIGALLTIYTAKLTAKWSQNKALQGIIPDEILQKSLPRAGKTITWAFLGVSIITLALMAWTYQ